MTFFLYRKAHFFAFKFTVSCPNIHTEKEKVDGSIAGLLAGEIPSQTYFSLRRKLSGKAKILSSILPRVLREAEQLNQMVLPCMFGLLYFILLPFVLSFRFTSLRCDWWWWDCEGASTIVLLLALNLTTVSRRLLLVSLGSEVAPTLQLLLLLMFLLLLLLGDTILTSLVAMVLAVVTEDEEVEDVWAGGGLESSWHWSLWRLSPSSVRPRDMADISDKLPGSRLTMSALMPKGGTLKELSLDSSHSSRDLTKAFDNPYQF